MKTKQNAVRVSFALPMNQSLIHKYLVFRSYSSHFRSPKYSSGPYSNYYSSETLSYCVQFFNELESLIEKTCVKEVYSGCRHVNMSFKIPYPYASSEFLILAFIKLVEQYAYTIPSPYVKFTIGYNVILPITNKDYSFTLSKAIPLFYTDGKPVPRCIVYDHIENRVRYYADLYHDSSLRAIFLNIYYEPTPECKAYIPPPSAEDVLKLIVNVMESKREGVNTTEIDVKSLSSVMSRIPKKINKITKSQSKLDSFVVADIETILVNNIHTPYAAGFLVVNPGDDLSSLSPRSIRTFFSEDYLPLHPKFEDRSYLIIHAFLTNLEVHVEQHTQGNLKTIYFHNFSRFDGLIILRYYIDRGKDYKIKTLFRNHRLYELKVYKGSKLLFRFRDSLTLLPSSLESLGKTLCPELGSKGSIPHDDLNVSNLTDFSEDVISYLRQDILLLGGVMLKAQEINWNKYGIDISNVMTLSALSLKIFRKHYLNEDNFHIHIPSKNEDTFIRQGFYGGHVDVYKPSGENLYYYDVNSLYPFVMKEFPMPCGVPTWKNKLECEELDSLFGFIEAYVECPPHISRPFLPYRNKKDDTLLFPSGKFVGVFYSEELKFARDLGYTIMPLRGYLFDKKPSPFAGFVSEIYESRLESKRKGDEALSFVYKILMNSLYGRFGINPESLVTEICNEQRYKTLMMQDNFQSAEKLNDHYYLVNFFNNSSNADDTDWKAPKMSAVHLAAAVTACARIHMYPYCSRDDCYYTDTDSVILGNPLPEEDISSSLLGKFKLEEKVKSGIFLAPKSYVLQVEDDRKIIKHKGPAKDLVTSEWFHQQLGDLSRTETIPHEANFRIDWKTLHIVKKEMILNLGLPLNRKRDNVYDSNNVWVDTNPKVVIDIGSTDTSTILKYVCENESSRSSLNDTDFKNLTKKPTKDEKPDE